VCVCVCTVSCVGYIDFGTSLVVMYPALALASGDLPI